MLGRKPAVRLSQLRRKQLSDRKGMTWPSRFPEAGAVLRAAGDEVAQDWSGLAAYLAGVGHDLDLSSSPRQFAGGYGNLNYLIQFDGSPAVLRRPPPGPLPPGANDMAREHRVIAGLSPLLPLVPEPRHFCADETVLGSPFLIMEYRPGIVIRGAIPARYRTRRDLGAMLTRTMVGFLAALHDIDPARAGLNDLGRPAGFLARAVAGWAKRADIAADGDPPAAVGALVAWLERHKVPDQAPALLHNDFKLDNVILDPNDLEPIAVIDWDMGSRGDPLFDLGTLLSYWVEADDPPAMHEIGQMPTAGHGFPGRRAVVDAYAALTGRDVSSILFYRVLCAFKLGVVFLQLYARWRRGETVDPKFAEFGRLGVELLDFAVEIAGGKRF